MESIPDNNTPLLVVDDDPGLLLSIKATIVSSGMPEPAIVSDSRKVMELVRKFRFHLILLDLNIPYLNGMDLLEQIKKQFPETECVIITAIDEVTAAVKAMRFGAYDYIVKPINSEKLIIIINRALERYNLKHELSLYGKKQSFADIKNPAAFKDMVANDEAMALVFRQVEMVAPTDYSVVICGESGTGKEMLARIIHQLSNRCHGRFVAVNMAAFSKTIFEDEFFGHTKGAYTDASMEKRGFFEAAMGGTLFMDEITELELALQGKLLRVIEERELYRLGSTKARNIDVRIISATNKDINEEIKKGLLRADLFYRLNIYNITIPPLRERKKDILPLAIYFLKKHAKINHKKINALAPDLIEQLSGYSFPGNVRELENIIASAVLLENGHILTLSSANEMISGFQALSPDKGSLCSLAEMEKEHILQVLEHTKGNRTMAANILGINTSTVYRKIQQYNISDIPLQSKEKGG